MTATHSSAASALRPSQRFAGIPVANISDVMARMTAGGARLALLRCVALAELALAEDYAREQTKQRLIGEFE